MNRAAPATSPAEPERVPRRGSALRYYLFVLLVAFSWRYLLASQSPTISRDGVLYCWQARELHVHGLAALRAGTFDQHPLYAIAIRAAYVMLPDVAGPVDEPRRWQRAGQVVSLLSGMAVVGLAAVLTWRLHRRLTPGGDPRVPTVLTMAIAAMLPLNTSLSADVMSDQLHAALYLGAACLMVELTAPSAALACGLLTGLAFLTRPEGGVCLIGATVALLAGRAALGWGRAARQLALLIVGFAMIAGPYVAAIGTLTPKLEKEGIEQFQPQPPTPSPAALVRREVNAALAGLFAAIELLRAGRVVVPLLAIPALILLRRRWREPALCGLLTCAAVHFALTSYLLLRHGYLHPRHQLVLVLLLMPAAAATLAALLRRPAVGAGRWWGPAALLTTFGVLGFYSLRAPGAGETHITEAADALRASDRQVGLRKIVAGASLRRVAFYCDMRWQPWGENLPSADARYEDLFGHIFGGQADYFAIETGPGEELAGNEQLLDRLKHDARLTRYIVPVIRISRPGGVTAHILRFDWTVRAGSAPGPHPRLPSTG